ncbi:hypothetical protein CMI48_03360 [Candidatus Pacearchaeota archaeon]|nr:hypothetical protein [Candidatus Pacearchaeota archaeon]|tara:strand:+ start:380 stop:625 length:246 start_codon:yes stop_codon:yes gene_type:complete
MPTVAEYFLRAVSGKVFMRFDAPGTYEVLEVYREGSGWYAKTRHLSGDLEDREECQIPVSDILGESEVVEEGAEERPVPTF